MSDVAVLLFSRFVCVLVLFCGYELSECAWVGVRVGLVVRQSPGQQCGMAMSVDHQSQKDQEMAASRQLMQAWLNSA